MIIRSSIFVKSSSQLKECPKPLFPEYAFIGRSNVGKSSLINTLAGKKKLAKTSGTPGKTRLINHYLINDEWYLVDLPGLGYARISQSERKNWMSFISAYLQERKNLLNTFMLVDARIEPQAIDLDFMQELGVNKIPFSIVFTKTDKLKLNELNCNIELYHRHLLFDWEELPRIFITSSETRRGRKEILDHICDLNKVFIPELLK
jgi:GTP-binding protein